MRLGPRFQWFCDIVHRRKDSIQIVLLLRWAETRMSHTAYQMLLGQGFSALALTVIVP